MALITSFTLIRLIALVHLTAAYFFLVNPGALSDHNTVFMLGASVQLPQVSALTKHSDSNAFIAVLFAFLGIADFTAASLTDLVALEYWLSQVPVRLTFLFGLTGYIYLCKEGGIFYNSGSIISAGAYLCNGWTFTWSFLEMMAWFWVYTSLREERLTLAHKLLADRKKESDD